MQPKDAALTKNTIIILALCLLFISCAFQQNNRSDVSGKLLYKDVPLLPGSVAWSPDSSSIAIIKGESLIIHDTKSGSSRIVSEIKPIFAEWSGDGLLIVRDSDGASELVIMDEPGGKARVVEVEGRPRSARWYRDGEAVVLSTVTKRRSIGTFVTYILTKVDTSGAEKFYSWEAYFPTREEKIDFALGWMYSGIRPWHEVVLAPQFHDPPAFVPYTVLKTIDPVTAMDEELFRFESGRVNFASSWSPDGFSLALTDDKGRLMIADLTEDRGPQIVNDEVRGRLPSWAPSGGLIYHGGRLLKPDGTVVRRLPAGAGDFAGIWSPDGRKLITVNASGLMLYTGMPGTDIIVEKEMSEFRSKLRMLKELVKDGLLTKGEYIERRKGLIKKLRLGTH